MKKSDHEKVFLLNAFLLNLKFKVKFTSNINIIDTDTISDLNHEKVHKTFITINLQNWHKKRHRFIIYEIWEDIKYVNFSKLDYFQSNGKAPTRAYHTTTLFRHEMWVIGGVFPRPDPQPDGCDNNVYIFSPVMENWYMPIVTGEKPRPRSG